MDDEKQADVLLHLNINDAGPSNINQPWQEPSSPSNISTNETNDSGLYEVQEYLVKNFNQDNTNGLAKEEFEFVKKHASDVDPDILHSLLDSQNNNPNRLKVVMCDLLNIPNAFELVKEYQDSVAKAGEKRSFKDLDIEIEEVKKKKNKNSQNFLALLRDMFPDADDLFLISESQQIETEEDFSRFVNTVMLSGVYPKKEVEFISEADTRKIVDVSSDSAYRTVVIYSSEDEISSSGLSESSKERRSKKAKNKKNSTNDSSDTFYSLDVEVVDIASDNTEIYDVPDPNSFQKTLDDNSNNSNGANTDKISVEPRAWETSLGDDIDKLLQIKFGAVENSPQEAPKVGPAREKSPSYRSRLSVPGRSQDFFTPELSLAEIIEQRRQDRQRSIDSSVRISNIFQRSSTSKAKSESLASILAESLNEISEVSSPEVSTTSDSPKKKNGPETDPNISEDGEEFTRITDEWLDEQTANLIRIFPNTDPSFLREEVEKMRGSTEAVNEFVVSKLEKNDMPTRAEYEKKKEMEELQNRYTLNFSIEDFLKAVPDPWKYFSQKNRNCAKYKNHSLCYLKSAFRKRYVKDIIDTFNKNNYNLYISYHDLKKEEHKRRTNRRSDFECNSNRPTTIDIQFLQEVAFIENEEKIRDYLEGEKIAKQIKFDEAKRAGSLLECQCCFDSEVMVEDIFYCPRDHAFCRECITKSVEVEMGNGKCQFECLTNCDEKFTIACLQNALKPELFSKVLQATQLEEIKAAEIDDLVQCPFCNYATVMPPEEKVMTCLNPECLKESCRSCKELNHIPLRCDEVEKSEDVKMRTYIENKMTEALVRTCYKCGKKFVKEDGCNKMTCTCGAKMCYVCRKPVTDYSHFNGLGGTEFHKCPLYAVNDELHVDLVQKVGEEAKAEILKSNPQARLLHDPTMIMPEKTHERPMPGTRLGVALNTGLLALRGFQQQGNRERVKTKSKSPRKSRNNTSAPRNRHSRRHSRAQTQSSDSDYDEDDSDYTDDSIESDGSQNNHHHTNGHGHNRHSHHHHHHHHHPHHHHLFRHKH